MKYIYPSLIAVLLLMSNVGKAISISDYFLKLPLSILPYFSTEDKDILVHSFKEKGDTVLINHSLSGKATLNRLTDNYLDINNSECSRIQLFMDKDKENGDTVVYFINTVYAPAAESSITKLDLEYKVMANYIIDEPIVYFISDTLSSDMRQKAENAIEFKMIEVGLIPEEKMLELQLSMPQLSSEEKDELKGCFVRKKIAISSLKSK